jgi:HEAT repeat protein
MSGSIHHNAFDQWGCAPGEGKWGLVFMIVWIAGCGGSGKPAGEAEAKLPVAELQERLKSPDTRDRLGAVHGLRRHGSSAVAAVPDLIRLLRDDPDLQVRQGAALALGDIGPQAAVAVPELIRVMQKETDAPLRRQAAGALGKIGAAAQAALPALRQVIQDGPPIVRQAAEEAIKSIQASLPRK